MAKVTERYLEERRREILDAAARVFIEKGYPAATMQEIASACGLAPGSLYRYFPGKADLIAAVVGDCMAAYHDVVGEVTAAAATPATGLRLLGEHVAEAFRPDAPAYGNPHATVEGLVPSGPGQLAWQEECTLRLESYLAGRRDEALRGRLEEPLRETLDDLAAVIRRAQEGGELDRGVDADALALLLHASVAGLSALTIPLRDAEAASSAWRVLIQLVSTLLVERPASAGD